MLCDGQWQLAGKREISSNGIYGVGSCRSATRPIPVVRLAVATTRKRT